MHAESDLLPARNFQLHPPTPVPGLKVSVPTGRVHRLDFLAAGFIIGPASPPTVCIVLPEW